MSNKYAGAGPVPKGKTRATMKQSAEMGQVRYYGIKKIDPKTLENSKKKDVIPETENKLKLLIASLRGLVNRNKGRYEGAKDEKTKEQYLKDWKKAESDLKKALTKLKKVLEDK